MSLSPNDFTAFFREMHGCEPFPWQQRLLRRLAEDGRWPAVLDLPTGSGKTVALDIAVFHLALEADSAIRRAPVRIAYIVDRRLVVDDAFRRAEKLSEGLLSPPGPVTRRVAERLLLFSAERQAWENLRPLIARRLRGGLPREDDWARTPSQPTILCSTVDQVGSRLLFRGYGVSDSMKPVHAGLLGADCLILLDEAHLAEPFRQTLNWVAAYRSERWRESTDTTPWGVSLLTATPGERLSVEFGLEDDDLRHAVLQKRLAATKPARLIEISKARASETPNRDQEVGDTEQAVVQRTVALVREVQRALDHFREPSNGAPAPAIGVVVNRVARARSVHARLCAEFHEQIENGMLDRPCLFIGPARQVERDNAAEMLRPIRTGELRALDRPLILVATQCIEAGVDIDLDALITDAAPLDALRQRFGRLNRAGRDITPYAAIVAMREDVSTKARDPVYGQAIRHAWARLKEAATKVGRELLVDFGLSTFAVRLSDEALSPKLDAPVLMPAHVDLLSQTSPIPAADPEIACFLHGPERQPDSVAVVWRADIDSRSVHEDDVERLRRLLTLVPPRAGEAIEMPISMVRAWLSGSRSTALLADVPSDVSEAEPDSSRGERRRVFRWKGQDARSTWIRPEKIRPGDTIIVPASYGGVDEFGWNILSKAAVPDVARHAALPFAGRRFFVRVAPGLVPPQTENRLAETLAGVESRHWKDVRDALLELGLPAGIHDDLLALSDARRPGSVTADLHVYGETDQGFPRGVLFVAPFGIKSGLAAQEGMPNSTEDDISGSLLGLPVTLAQHSADVERRAEQFARAAGLSADRVHDLKLAGYLHDLGKADPRFQAWLHYGDPLGIGFDASSNVLAKSGRSLPRTARTDSGLPENWRHEAFSVRLATLVPRFAEAKDPDLVLWLVGVHHGYGRPFFPHADPLDRTGRPLPAVCDLPAHAPAGPGPQSLAFDWRGADWPKLFERLRARYGAWGLAHMEAILRLADHRASEDATELRK